MTLDSTVPSSPSYISQYGCPVTVFPASQLLRIEVWRAPDNGSGAANDAAAVQATVLPPGPMGGVTFIDPLPNDGAKRYYKSRHIDDAGTVSTFTLYSEGLVPELMTGANGPNPVAAFGAIVDQMPPSAKYEIRFASSYSDPDVQDGMQSYIDFAATTNFMRIGQTPKDILGSTAVNPSVVNVTAHGFLSGDTVVIRGHLTNTAINGPWTVTYVDPDHFSVPVLGIGGGGGATGHVVRLSLTIGPAGDLSVYATIRAAVLSVLGLSSFSDVATFLGGALFRNSLQHSTAGAYLDTGFNRVLLNENSLKVIGDAGTGTDNEAVRAGTYSVAVGSPTARTTANQSGTTKGWAGGTSGGTDSMTRTTKGLVNESAGNLLFNRIGDPDGGDDGTATGTQTSTTLQDTSKTWTVNQYTGQEVRITGGTGSGQTRTIVSNTSNTLTVAAWGTTPVSASSTYTIAGDNIDAYDDNYVLKFRVRANVGSLPVDYFITSTAHVSYSTDGGTTWTQLSATYTTTSSFGDGTVTNTFTPTVVVSGSPTQLRFRLDFSTTVSGPGTISGSATGDVFVFATAFGSDAYALTWSTFAGTTKTRRSLKAFATTDGADNQPHAYFEPVAAVIPDANVAEGELQFVGGTSHALAYRDDEKMRYVPKLLGSQTDLTTTSTTEVKVGNGVLLKAGRLGAVGNKLRVRVSCRNGTGVTGQFWIRFNTSDASGGTSWATMTLTVNGVSGIMDYEFIVSAVGAGGALKGGGFVINNSTNLAAADEGTLNIDTTVDQYVVVTAKTPSGTITIRTFSVEWSK